MEVLKGGEVESCAVAGAAHCSCPLLPPTHTCTLYSGCFSSMAFLASSPVMPTTKSNDGGSASAMLSWVAPGSSGTLQQQRQRSAAQRGALRPSAVSKQERLSTD